MIYIIKKRIKLILSLIIAIVLLNLLTKQTLENTNHQLKSKKLQINMENDITSEKGTFAYDKFFLEKNGLKSISLKDPASNAMILIVPEYQARVMTSSAQGDSGHSYGWINYSLIESGKKAKHFNAYGGEERLWLGPEGGPFSIYFNTGTEQEFNNWNVPKEIDTEPFELINKSNNSVEFKRDFRLTNYSGSEFNIGIERKIKILSINEIEKQFNFKLNSSVNFVAYETENILINKGKSPWTKESGMLSIWLLSMLNPSPDATIIVPYKNHSENESGKIINDDYFGKVPSDRLKIDNGIVYFKADGKYRSKIGVPPLRAKEFCGSYDAGKKSLTILWCKIPSGEKIYLNSKWGKQLDPFSGDVINAYNDGPIADGTQLGPFYELESSSPAANLNPGKSLTHIQRIFHFEGDERILNKLSEKILGVSIKKISQIWNK